MLFLVPPLVDETLALLQGPLCSQGIDVEKPLHPSLSPVIADRDQLKQVLLNVLHNAVQAMPRGGMLRIDAFDLHHDGVSGVQIAISDSGVGISSEALAHVFQPFFTTGKPQDTGLGLAICRNIVDAHRGEIILESQPGSGTTVRIWLPLKPASGILAG